MGNFALVREHDWYDSLAQMWENCFSLRNVFNLSLVNPTIVGGYNCQGHGIPAFSPIAILLSTLPPYLGYVSLYFIIATMCFLSIYYFTKTIKIPIHWSLIIFLAFAQFYSIMHVYFSFSLDPAALLISAFLLKGEKLDENKIYSYFLLIIVLIFAISMPAPFYIPFHTFTTLAVSLIFIKYSCGGFKGIIKRFTSFWFVVFLINLPTISVLLQSASGSMRKDFYPYWGPFSFYGVAKSAFEGLTTDWHITWLGLLLLSIYIILYFNNSSNSKFSYKTSLFSVLLFLFIYFTSRIGAPYLSLLAHHYNVKNILTMNQWNRFYLTFHSVQLVIFFSSLKNLIFSQMNVVKFNLKKVLLAVSLIIVSAWALSHSVLYWRSLVYVPLLLAIIINLGKHKFKDYSNVTNIALLVVLLFSAVKNRKHLSRRFEHASFVSYSVPNVKKLSDQISLIDKMMYRAISIAIHPSFSLVNKFKMADGYLTFYPLSYKRNFQETFSPALVESDGNAIPYFRHWGGRAYVFLPGSREGVFQQGCPLDPIDFNSLANITKVKELAVKWIFSRCQLMHPEIKQIFKPEAIKYPLSFTKKYIAKLQRVLSYKAIHNEPIAAYIYEVKNPKKIFEVHGDDVFIRANVCLDLIDEGFRNSEEKFGFLISKNSPHWPIAQNCYPELKEFF
ncbi:MAG: hypothetical protein ISR65_07765 [Bacteriovoracaceae bacterium]|nr:hypothetical protein [Bacteriovoracaceae bacterium]